MTKNRPPMLRLLPVVLVGVFVIIQGLLGNIIASLISKYIPNESQTYITFTFVLITIGIIVYQVRESIRPVENDIESYSKKLSILTSNLLSASKEVDLVLAELTRVARERETAVTKLDETLKQLELREQTQRRRIEEAEKLQPDSVKYLLSLMEPGEKKSARRDYTLFIAGLIVSTLISIVLKILGLA